MAFKKGLRTLMMKSSKESSEIHIYCEFIFSSYDFRNFSTSAGIEQKPQVTGGKDCISSSVIQNIKQQILCYYYYYSLDDYGTDQPKDKILC